MITNTYFIKALQFIAFAGKICMGQFQYIRIFKKTISANLRYNKLE